MSETPRATTQPPTSRPTSRPRARRGRRWLFVLIVLGTIGSVQELVFRALFPVPEVIGFNRINYQLMAGTPTSFRAAVKRGLAYDRLLFESRPDGYSEVHALNLYGFRDRDFSIDPTPGTRRILLIGDRLVEGQGAPESSTIAAAWRRILSAEGGPGLSASTEVISLGVVAADLYRTTRLTHDAVPLLRPTDLVFVIYANDLPAPEYARELDGPPPRFERRQAPWWTPRAAELIARVATEQPIYRRWPHGVVPFFAPVPSPLNPWTGQAEPPASIDPALYRAMAAGTINPWLAEQAEKLPAMLAHDFTRSGLPNRYLNCVVTTCRRYEVNLVFAYIPFYGVTSPRYAKPLRALGMDPAVADALATDPIYRRQNLILADDCRRLHLPLADATDALTRAEASGVPQFWDYDSHPRPAGYETIAQVIHRAWANSGRESVGKD